MKDTCLKCTIKLSGVEACFGCVLVKENEKVYVDLLKEQKHDTKI